VSAAWCRVLVGASLSVLAVSAGATRVTPAPGRWTATLCVWTSTAPPNCGPVQADLARDGSMQLRIDDIVYHLRLHSTQVDIVLMHGAMQIDEFTVPYMWSGRTLKFSDDEHDARYEVRFPPRKSDGR
jgi:hypothetical protein